MNPDILLRLIHDLAAQLYAAEAQLAEYREKEQKEEKGG